MTDSLYETDFYAWTQKQAQLLRDRNLDALDLPNLVDEIEDMGRREKRELVSRLEVLLIHLLKWQFQPSLRSRSWQLTLKEQRLRLERLLGENPSLKAGLGDYLEDAYRLATIGAEKETGLNLFPSGCPYSIEQILDPNFLPNDPPVG